MKWKSLGRALAPHFAATFSLPPLSNASSIWWKLLDATLLLWVWQYSSCPSTCCFVNNRHASLFNVSTWIAALSFNGVFNPAQTFLGSENCGPRYAKRKQWFFDTEGSFPRHPYGKHDDRRPWWGHLFFTSLNDPFQRFLSHIIHQDRQSI
jgi:hypothetical protein